MKTKKYAGTQFRWESGGKSLEIENKYRVRPFCKIVFESDKIIQEPEKIVERLLGVMFPKRVDIVKIKDKLVVKDMVNTRRKELIEDKVIEEIKQDEEKAPFFNKGYQKENPNNKLAENMMLNQCKRCGKICKSKAGLSAHIRKCYKPKKENKDGNKKK